MTAVVQGTSLTPTSLQWQITTPFGVPLDVYAIDYQIETSFNDGDPDQVVVAYTSALANKISTGLYYALWDIPEDQPHGTYKIRWRWQITDSSAVQSAFVEFEVLSTNALYFAPQYITPERMYDEGVPRTVPEQWLRERIKIAQEYIERVTGHFFIAKQEDYLLDGTGLEIMDVPHPIINIVSIAFQNTLTSYREQPMRYFAVYNRQNTEDRFNPHIKVKSYSISDIFDSVDAPGIFPEGHQNIKVSGVFGFVDENGQTPAPIQWATAALVLKFIDALATDAAIEARTGAGLVSENTDGHSYRLSEKMRLGRLTGDAEIDGILIEYSKGGSVSFA